MQDSSEQPPENSFLPLARALGRSRIGQIFAAFLTLILFAGLAYFAYHDRDFTVRMVVLLLIFVGLKKAWDCLPFKAVVRNRWGLRWELWEKHQKILEGHPAYFWRNGVFLGILDFANQLWDTHFIALPSTQRLVQDGIFVLIGVISFVLCWRAVRQAETSHFQEA